MATMRFPDNPNQQGAWRRGQCDPKCTLGSSMSWSVRRIIPSSPGMEMPLLLNLHQLSFRITQSRRRQRCTPTSREILPLYLYFRRWQKDFKRPQVAEIRCNFFRPPLEILLVFSLTLSLRATTLNI